MGEGVKVYQSKQDLMRNHYIEQLLKYDYSLSDLKEMDTSDLKFKLTVERAKNEDRSVWF